MVIWVDADACPKMIKEVIFITAIRRSIPVTLVANNFLQIPPSPLLSFIQVEQGADVADFYIVKNCGDTDLVITADIPLAALIVEKNAIAVNPRGEIYTEDNINERLSMRNYMQELRDNGMETGGPAPLGPKDKASFTNSLDRILTKMIKEQSK